MKSFLWFVIGVLSGFVAAHYVNKDPRGRDALAELDARITEFTDRMTDAYRAQEAAFAGGPGAAGDEDDASERPSPGL